MKRVVPIAASAFLIIGLTVAQPAWSQFFFMQNPLLEEPAPEFELDLARGGKDTFTNYRAGQSAIVFFWATWCPHCRTQLKQLNDQANQLEKKGIKVVLVDLEEGPRVVNKYLDDNGIDFDVFLDKDASVSEEYGIIGVPTFFFVNKKGIVKGVEHSIPEDYEDMLM